MVCIYSAPCITGFRTSRFNYSLFRTSRFNYSLFQTCDVQCFRYSSDFVLIGYVYLNSNVYVCVHCFRYSSEFVSIGYDFLNSKVYIRGTQTIQSYARWKSTQRDNAGGSEFCISVKDSLAEWWDVECTFPQRGLCSKFIGT